MSSTMLEKARLALSEMETLESLAVEALDERRSGAKASMERDHVVASASKNMAKRARYLTEPNVDFEEEKTSMRGNGVFTSFYGQLKVAREFYAKHPGVEEEKETSISRESLVSAKFSGEEVWGKYVDFSNLHLEFCNLPGAFSLDYLAYLRMMRNRPFSQHASIFEVKNLRASSKYVQYVNHVEDYLVDFWKRSQPLIPLAEIDEEKEEAAELIDLEGFRSAEELRALGLDRLRQGLRALGMKCGGDLDQRAERLFSVKGLKPEEIDAKLLAKKKRTDDDVKKKEKRIEAILSQLESVLEATQRRAERKLTRTKQEIDQEYEDETNGIQRGGRDDEEEDEDEEEEEDDLAAIYNPKNLPLGWDGRPIPYWLYKLHGLDTTFKCEICGNHTYYGRRNFEQHFNEWRHAHGMRCLRIPNTSHFFGITKMDDAIALWELLQEKVDSERFRPDRDEEYEDSDGNVLNRATYEDLARQGLL